MQTGSKNRNEYRSRDQDLTPGQGNRRAHDIPLAGPGVSANGGEAKAVTSPGLIDRELQLRECVRRAA